MDALKPAPSETPVDTHSSAADRIKASRTTIKAGLEPGAVPVATRPGGLRDFSVVDAVVDGIEQWWQSHPARRAAATVTPLAEPYLRPLVRRHYKAMLVGSAAAGALASLAPWRSARIVAMVVGPVLLSGLIAEVAKASVRQATGKPRRHSRSPEVEVHVRS